MKHVRTLAQMSLADILAMRYGILLTHVKIITRIWLEPLFSLDEVYKCEVTACCVQVRVI